MRPFLFYATQLIVVLSSCSSNNRSICQTYRQGTFTVASKIDSGQFTIIYRNDTTQLEVIPNLRDTVLEAIHWTGPCDYELKYLKRNAVKNDSLTKFFDSKVLKVQILNAQKDYYIFKMFVEGIEFSYIDTMKKIN